jgi:hypothetical protein
MVDRAASADPDLEASEQIVLVDRSTVYGTS